MLPYDVLRDLHRRAQTIRRQIVRNVAVLSRRKRRGIDCTIDVNGCLCIYTRRLIVVIAEQDVRRKTERRRAIAARTTAQVARQIPKHVRRRAAHDG